MTIVEDKDIRFGKPVIAGTRVAVKDIVEAFYGAGRSTADIAEDFDISEEEVEEALRYHHETEHAGQRAGAPHLRCGLPDDRGGGGRA